MPISLCWLLAVMYGVWPTWPPHQNWTYLVRRPRVIHTVNTTLIQDHNQSAITTISDLLMNRPFVWQIHSTSINSMCCVDTKPEVATAMLRWAYTDQLELNEDDIFLVDLMKLANRFQLHLLRER